jgi:HAMP domain-containing protein
MVNITTRLFLSFVLIAVIPLSLIGFLGLSQMQAMSRQTVDEGTAAMKKLGEDAIQQKALDVAKQVELYFEAHPDLVTDTAKLMADPELGKIGVQPVGKTGYTAVYDSSGVTYLHSNPALMGQNMEMLAEKLPAFWALFSASLDGSVVGAYYDWADPDGTIRQKYMQCVPVGGTQYRVAATTYIDEFYQPIKSTETQAALILEKSRFQLLVSLLVVALLAVGLSVWFSGIISRPISALVEGFRAVEEDASDSVKLDGVVERKDEFGWMARVFVQMARQVYSREQTMKEQIAYLRIEVDESKRSVQVQQITETEYFHDLVKKVNELRKKRSPDRDVKGENKG